MVWTWVPMLHTMKRKTDTPFLNLSNFLSLSLISLTSLKKHGLAVLFNFFRKWLEQGRAL